MDTTKLSDIYSTFEQGYRSTEEPNKMEVNNSMEEPDMQEIIEKNARARELFGSIHTKMNPSITMDNEENEEEDMNKPLIPRTSSSFISTSAKNAIPQDEQSFSSQSTISSKDSNELMDSKISEIYASFENGYIHLNNQEEDEVAFAPMGLDRNEFDPIYNVYGAPQLLYTDHPNLQGGGQHAGDHHYNLYNDDDDDDDDDSQGPIRKGTVLVIDTSSLRDIEHTESVIDDLEMMEAEVSPKKEKSYHHHQQQQPPIDGTNGVDGMPWSDPPDTTDTVEMEMLLSKAERGLDAELLSTGQDCEKYIFSSEHKKEEETSKSNCSNDEETAKEKKKRKRRKRKNRGSGSSRCSSKSWVSTLPVLDEGDETDDGTDDNSYDYGAAFRDSDSYSCGSHSFVSSGLQRNGTNDDDDDLETGLIRKRDGEHARPPASRDLIVSATPLFLEDNFQDEEQEEDKNRGLFSIGSDSTKDSGKGMLDGTFYGISRKRTFFMGCVVLLCISLLLIAYGILTGEQGDNKNSGVSVKGVGAGGKGGVIPNVKTFSPSSVPTSSPMLYMPPAELGVRKDAMRLYLSSISPDGAAAWDEVDSPQSRALTWLIEDGANANIDPSDDSPANLLNIRQRYAAATFWMGSESEWAKDTNWMSEAPVCEWHGMGCGEPLVNGDDFQDTEGRQRQRIRRISENSASDPLLESTIYVIDLSDNNLKGKLVPEIALFDKLEVLRLYNNELTDKIPLAIYSMSTLREIDFDGNKLWGQLEPLVGNLVNLEFLYLSRNEFSGEIPAEIGSLVNLKRLWFQRNNFSGEIPWQIGQLSSLVDLILDNNSLTGELPREIGDILGLERLIVSFNNLTGRVPGRFLNLEALNVLMLDGNNFDHLTIPSVIYDMPSLKVLGLSFLNLRGEIGADISNLDLTDLFLNNNMFEGEIPAAIGTMTNLVRLHMDDNSLEGTIPTELGDLVNLKELKLHDNLDITGPLPTELGRLTSLESLTLKNNRIDGQLPTELGELANLVVLSLYENSFEGPIPSEIGLLDKLGESLLLITALYLLCKH